MFHHNSKKKQEEKSHDMQLSPNHGKCDCDVKRNHMTGKNSHQTAVNTIVTSQAQILTQWSYRT